MFPGYWSEGAGDKTCSKCTRYRPNVTNKNKGTCVGRDVVATGSCEMFVRKKSITKTKKVIKTKKTMPQKIKTKKKVKK